MIGRRIPAGALLVLGLLAVFGPVRSAVAVGTVKTSRLHRVGAIVGLAATDGRRFAVYAIDPAPSGAAFGLEIVIVDDRGSLRDHRRT
jgi:hypothetical protein